LVREKEGVYQLQGCFPSPHARVPLYTHKYCDDSHSFTYKEEYTQAFKTVFKFTREGVISITTVIGTGVVIIMMLQLVDHPI
jgi:hypothetical protein